MDAIKNNKGNLGIGAPRVDHSARMDRVDTALQEQGVAVAQLNPQQISDARGYAALTLENIDKVTGLGPSGEAGAQVGTAGPSGGQSGIPGIIDLRSPEQREKDQEKELEDKVREKTDPKFAAQKKAERTALKLYNLFFTAGDTFVRGGFGPGFGGLVGGGFGPSQDEKNHQADLGIVDALYAIEPDEMAAVRTEYEKNYGKTLEGEVLSRFRGDVQQKLLAIVRGEAKGGGAEAGEKGEGGGAKGDDHPAE